VQGAVERRDGHEHRRGRDLTEPHRRGTVDSRASPSPWRCEAAAARAECSPIHGEGTLAVPPIFVARDPKMRRTDKFRVQSVRPDVPRVTTLVPSWSPTPLTGRRWAQPASDAPSRKSPPTRTFVQSEGFRSLSGRQDLNLRPPDPQAASLP
jgi:hypothetical protein